MLCALLWFNLVEGFAEVHSVLRLEIQMCTITAEFTHSLRETKKKPTLIQLFKIDSLPIERLLSNWTTILLNDVCVEMKAFLGDACENGDNSCGFCRPCLFTQYTALCANWAWRLMECERGLITPIFRLMAPSFLINDDTCHTEVGTAKTYWLFYV